MFFTLFGYWAHGGGLLLRTSALCLTVPVVHTHPYPIAGDPKGFVRNLLMQFFTLGSSKIKITSQRLLDPSQGGVYRGKGHILPHFGPF